MTEEEYKEWCKKHKKKEKKNSGKKSEMDRLIRTAKAADDAGMTYGYYVAKYGVVK